MSEMIERADQDEISRLRALVEQAFRDGFALATLIYITPDYAWQQSKVRASLKEQEEGN